MAACWVRQLKPYRHGMDFLLGLCLQVLLAQVCIQLWVAGFGVDLAAPCQQYLESFNGIKAVLELPPMEDSASAAAIAPPTAKWELM